MALSKRVQLVLPDFSFQVETFGDIPSLPDSLVFVKKAKLSDFCNIHEPFQISYLYQFDQPSQICLQFIQDKISEDLDSNPLTVWEFENPEHLDQVYIISHWNSSEGLGRHFAAMVLGIFAFNLDRITTGCSTTYITNLRQAKITLFREYQLLKAQVSQIVRIIQTKQNQIEFERHQSWSLKQEVANNKQAAKQFNRQVRQLVATCEYCNQRRKNMVFLPCAHIVGCENCMRFRVPTSDLGIPINPSKCQYCYQDIQEVKQVQYS